MWTLDLNNIDKCQELCDLCDRHSDIDVDVCYKRYLVDGRSFLGILSLLNHKVIIVIHTDSKFKKESFMDDLKEIGGQYE